MNYKKIPDNAIRRLPGYLRCCESALANGCDVLSSEGIASMLGCNAANVRLDLNYFGDFGQKGVGYSTVQLKHELEQLLGLKKKHRAVIVGVGGFGRTMLEHMDMSQAGYELLAGFEIDKSLVGQRIGGVTIQDASCLEDFMRENHVEMCVIAVTDEAAQSVANIAAECGVAAILNVTNVQVQVRYDIFVENIHFYDSMLRMGYHLSNCG